MELVLQSSVRISALLLSSRVLRVKLKSYYFILILSNDDDLSIESSKDIPIYKIIKKILQAWASSRLFFLDKIVK